MARARPSAPVPLLTPGEHHSHPPPSLSDAHNPDLPPLRLHDTVVTVSFTLKNTGAKAGTEVPQLYTSPPASAKQAPMNLKGFDAVFLQPGESKTVTFELSRYDFSVWDVPSQSWQIASGVTGLSVGASSRDIKLKGSITN